MKIALLVFIISSFLYSQNIPKKDFEAKNEDLAQKIKILEKIVFEQNKLLKSKEYINKNQFINSDENLDKYSFPKLMMKEAYQAKLPEGDKIVEFEPSSFRLKTDSIIYDTIDGNKIDKWERGRSFTSSTKTNSWIKISGYFVKKKWKKADGDMWVKRAQVVKR
ncbi:MAG: hypothetical protein WC390_05230 [Sulfurimonas sp.]|jgi:hypothetical protein